MNVMKFKISKKWIALSAAAVVLAGAAFTSYAFAALSNEVTILTGGYQQTLMSGKYAITKDVSYTGGLTIPSGQTVYIDVPAGTTLTCKGQDAYYKREDVIYNMSFVSFQSSTAGIVVEEGATLHLTGEGAVNVKGGNGSAAQVGEQGLDYGITFLYVQWFFKDNVYFTGGSGGRGSAGANAPSAAIGGSGGAGGKRTNSVGAPTDAIYQDDGTTNTCQIGSPGRDGNTGDDGGAMGTVYIEGSLDVTATAGGDSSSNPNESYKKAAAGGTFSSSAYNVCTGGNGWTIHYSKGAPGGGGGAATDAAIIGGGGAGGGGGASGASAGYWAYKTGGYSMNTSYANGTAGVGTKGGNGGKTAQPGSVTNREGGQGGVGGTSGTGGTLYIAGTASVNDISGADLTQANLGAQTNASAGQGAEVKLLTRTEIQVTLDDSGYTDRTVSLHAKDLSPFELSESKTIQGTYFGYVPTGDTEFEIYVDGKATGYKLKANTTETVLKHLPYYTCEVDVNLDDAPYGGRNVRFMRNNSVFAELTEQSAGVHTAIILRDVNGNDTYAVYVDGEDYDKTLTVQLNAQVSAPFYTLTAKAKLYDGATVSDLDDQSVGIYRGTKYICLMENTSSGTYTAIVPGENKDGVYYYTIGVGEDRCSETLKAEKGATRTIDFYNGIITLKDGPTNNWSGQAVALVGGGSILNVKEQGTTGVYKCPLFGENSVEYTVTVGGVPTTGRIQITDENKRAAIVNFFTATVSLTKNGAAWTSDASVMLKQNDQTAYILKQVGNNFTLKGVTEGSYDVYVYGANSDAKTGMTVSMESSSAAVEFFTVTFHKNVSGSSSSSSDKVLIYQKNTVPAIASAPYESGYTFLSWRTGTSASSPEYVPVAITAKTDVYAAWVSPKVTLGSLVRCDENGTVKSDGAYLKFPNLSIQGYPTGSAVIGTLVINLENVKLITNTPPSGWANVGAWDSTSGNGNYIFQGSSSLTVAQAQSYLRNLVFQRNSTTGTCSVQMSVYGNTN